jgi:hypothetical protein
LVGSIVDMRRGFEPNDADLSEPRPK